jgi:tetratricopeptide (TPR) repeat protein
MKAPVRSNQKPVREKLRRNSVRPTDDRGRWRALLSGGALVALVLVAYLPVLKAGFVWDDDFHVTRNLTLQSLDGLRRMWFELGAVPQYYPFVHSTFWIEYHLWGLAPLGYHLVNVLLHAVNALLVWQLLERLRVPGAWLAAAIFAVHPVEVESVAWVTERKNVLSLSLALASILCYLRFGLPDEASQGAKRGATRWCWYSVALVFFVAALLSKTVVASLPAVVLVICWWRHGRVGLRDIAPLIPFFVLSIVLGLVTIWMEKYHVGAVGGVHELTAAERVLVAGRALSFYASKLVWPHPLVFVYPRWTLDPRAWWQYAFPVAAVSVLAGLWLARRRIGRGPAAAVLVFAGVLFPALGFFNVYPFRYSFVADHFQYHASITLIALATGAATFLVSRQPAAWQRIAKIAAAAVLAVLAGLTFRQASLYRDQVVLLSDVIEKNPKSTMPYANLAMYFDDNGRYEEAIEMVKVCLALEDEAARTGIEHNAAEMQYGLLLMEANRYEEAETQFARILRERPYELEALYGHGMALASLGRWDHARQRFETLLEHHSDYANAHYGMALVLRQEGDTEHAIQQFERALALNPSDALAHFELANTLAVQGKLPEAASHYAAVVKLEPNHARALNNLGVILKELGQTDRAISYLRDALRHDPDNADTRANLESAIEASRRK